MTTAQIFSRLTASSKPTGLVGLAVPAPAHAIPTSELNDVRKGFLVDAFLRNARAPKKAEPSFLDSPSALMPSLLRDALPRGFSLVTRRHDGWSYTYHIVWRGGVVRPDVALPKSLGIAFGTREAELPRELLTGTPMLVKEQILRGFILGHAAYDIGLKQMALRGLPVALARSIQEFVWSLGGIAELRLYPKSTTKAQVMVRLENYAQYTMDRDDCQKARELDAANAARRGAFSLPVIDVEPAGEMELWALEMAAPHHSYIIDQYLATG